MEGKHNESEIIEILDALLKKGETKDELGRRYLCAKKKSKQS